MTLSPPPGSSWDQRGACGALGLLRWRDAWELLGRAARSGRPADLASFSPCAGDLLRKGLSWKNRLREPSDWLSELFERSCQDQPAPGLEALVSWLETLPAKSRSPAFSPPALRSFDLLRLSLSYGLSEIALRLARIGSLRSRRGIAPAPPLQRGPAEALLSEMLFSRSAQSSPQAVELWSLYLASPCWSELSPEDRLWAMRSARAHPAFWVALDRRGSPLPDGVAALALLSPSPWARKGPRRLGSPIDDPSALSKNIELALERGWITPRQAAAYSRRKLQESPARIPIERFLLSRRLSAGAAPKPRRSV